MAKTIRDHRQINLFQPETTWTVPTELPFIPDGTRVAVDSETRDDGLNAGKGPGWPHRHGWLCGVSAAWRPRKGANEISSVYLPTRHPDTECFDEATVKDWLVDVEKRCELVFQNATYDLGWTGLRPTKRIRDTHAAAVLLDENRRDYSLDALCKLAGVPCKDEEILKEAAHAMGVDPKGGLWKLPAKYVGGYAEQDAVSTLMVDEWQSPQIINDRLDQAYGLECDLIPYIRDMRARGMRIDVDRCERLVQRYRGLRTDTLEVMQHHLPADWRRKVSMSDVRSSKWLSMIFKQLGLNFPYTGPTKANPEGNPSFEKEWLEAQDHPVCQLIVKARSLDDAAEKFCDNYILGHLHMGRLHAEINQLRDAGEGRSKGTRSYRFSYGNPPLQQMPRPEPDRATPGHKDFREGYVDIGSEIRGCFLPEDGEVFGAPDYSQQEYRWIVIKAAQLGLPGADDAVQKYNDDDSTDFHNYVRDITGLVRKRAKDCNFAKAFGAGIPKFAMMAKMTVEEATEIMSQYDEKLPFVKLLGKKAMSVAETRGFVRLLMGYRARFDTWECSWLEKDEWARGQELGQKMDPCSKEEAEDRRKDPDHVWHGKRLKRAKVHKAGNRVIQGSAAVQTKMALLAQAREGMLPLLQMHDELGHSVPNAVYARRIVEIMRDVVKECVPFKVDAEFGPTWGECKKDYESAVRAARL